LHSPLFVATNKPREDRIRSRQEREERGLPFSIVEEFDWGTAIFWEDARVPYGETRFVALGFIRGRLHIVCFTALAGAARVISFRKANTREVGRYEKEKAPD
jgi:uncharacterized DUF497 family protein